MYYLMIKTHNKTGLKYLCKTEREDYDLYLGSGVHWKRHLKKHGIDVSSEVIFKTDDFELFKNTCLKYSERFDVVKSKDWANMIVETGTDGILGYKHTPESKKKISDASKNKRKKLSKEHREKISNTLKGKPMSCSLKGVPKSKEHREKISKRHKGITRDLSEEQRKNLGNQMGNMLKKMYKCSVCGKIGNSGQIGRWHKQCMEDETWKKLPMNENQ